MMKISICIFCFVLLVVTINSYPAINIDTRGFKNEERFGHGFGKRTQSSNTDDLDSFLEKQDMSRLLMTNTRLASEIRSRPSLAEVIIGKFVDQNHDGYISEAELFPERTDEPGI